MKPIRLFPVVAFAVALLGASSLWLMYRVWQGQRPVDEHAQEQLSDQGAMNQREMQGKLTEQVSGTLSTLQQERMDSPLGLAMFRKCLEWTEFNERHASDTTLAHERQACSEYREYVRSGELPPEN
ncbi:MAG: hypothetical protein HKN77_03615 [Woeseiaceae bacterium]|nr:hypothetical protein [Woeseiaceae bacterium]